MDQMQDITLKNAQKTPKHEEPIQNIPILNSDITFNDFFEQFMLTNQPCIIKNVSNDWESTRNWLTEDKTQINFKYLLQKYASEEVLTYDCNTKYYNSHETQKMTFKNYLSIWLEGFGKKYPLLYLKDWHLKNHNPEDDFYSVPLYFSSDWLNEYLVALKKDDYRFVYMGPKGTWTPLHADVFKSYSWSVNVLGRKRWIFIPPGEEELLKDRLGNLPHEINNIVPECNQFIIEQEAGDAIFVPSGWHHQVINLEDTISINHNWLNGCNINLMYCDMLKHLEEVKSEIADCQGNSDFEVQCEIILKASYGMNFEEFLNFITWISQTRLKSKYPNNLNRFDLRMIKLVLDEFLLCKDIKILNLYENALTLLDEIESFLYEK